MLNILSALYSLVSLEQHLISTLNNATCFKNANNKYFKGQILSDTFFWDGPLNTAEGTSLTKNKIHREFVLSLE